MLCISLSLYIYIYIHMFVLSDFSQRISWSVWPLYLQCVYVPHTCWQLPDIRRKTSRAGGECVRVFVDQRLARSSNCMCVYIYNMIYIIYRVCAYIYIYINVYTYCVCLCVCVCLCIYIYVYTCIHITYIILVFLTKLDGARQDVWHAEAREAALSDTSGMPKALAPCPLWYDLLLLLLLLLILIMILMMIIVYLVHSSCATPLPPKHLSPCFCLSTNYF